MKRFYVSIVAFVFMSALVSLDESPQGEAQSEANGWVEGIVVRAQSFDEPLGLAVRLHGISSGGRSRGGGEFTAESDPRKGGYFSVRDVKPGVYTMMVVSNATGKPRYRPQLILGLIVKPGAHAVENMALKEGTALEVVGFPTACTEPDLHSGWLTGTVQALAGKSSGHPPALSVKLQGTTPGLGAVVVDTHPDTDGFFATGPLKPGVYDIIVDQTARNTGPAQRAPKYRPQHIAGIRISAGHLTILQIAMHPGDRPETVRHPNLTVKPITQCGAPPM